MWAGDLKEVSLCQAQIAGDVLPEGVQRVVVAKQTESDVRKIKISSSYLIKLGENAYLLSS